MAEWLNDLTTTKVPYPLHHEDVDVMWGIRYPRNSKCTDSGTPQRNTMNIDAARERKTVPPGYPRAHCFSFFSFFSFFSSLSLLFPHRVPVRGTCRYSLVTLLINPTVTKRHTSRAQDSSFWLAGLLRCRSGQHSRYPGSYCR